MAPSIRFFETKLERRLEVRACTTFSYTIMFLFLFSLRNPPRLVAEAHDCRNTLKCCWRPLVTDSPFDSSETMWEERSQNDTSANVREQNSHTSWRGLACPNIQQNSSSLNELPDCEENTPRQCPRSGVEELRFSSLTIPLGRGSAPHRAQPGGPH